MSTGVENIHCRGVKYKRGVSFVNFKWGNGDDIVLFNSALPKKSPDKKTSSSFTKPPNNDVCVMRWNCVLQETLKLLNELHTLFQKLQQCSTVYTESEFRIDLIRTGKQVRALLIDQTKTLQNAIDHGTYLDDPIFLAENQPFNTTETSHALHRLRFSVGRTLEDNWGGGGEGLMKTLKHAKANGTQYIIAQGSVGDPFPFLVAKFCAEMGMHAHLVLRAREGATHPEEGRTLGVSLLTPVQYKSRALYIAKLREDTRGPSEVIPDMGRAALAYTDMFELCRTMCSAWQLCEIFYWPTLPPSVAGLAVVTTLLVDWHQTHGYYEPPSVEDLQDSETFWDAVCKALVQGRTKDARAILRARPADAQSVSSARVVDELIGSMPWVYHNDTLADFELTWRGWQGTCATARLKYNEVTGPGRAISILCGDEDVLRHYANQWQDLFIALLLYKRPSSHLSELPHLLEHCMAVVTSDARFDLLLRAIARRDVYSTLTIMLEHYPSWFAAHLGDFLHYTTHLDPSPSEYGENVRERLLLTYGASLVGHRGLWQVSIDYLSQCGVFAAPYTQEIIDRQPLDSDIKVEKILRIAKTQQQQKNISRVYAMNQHTKGRYAACVEWLLRVGDNERLGEEVEWILSHIDTGVEKALPAIAAAAFTSKPTHTDATTTQVGAYEPRLVFLDKYYQLSIARKTGDVVTQAKILSQILTNRIAPRKFWNALLLECVPLLESTHSVATAPLFNAQDTCQLIACVEDLVIDNMYVEGSTVDVTDLRLETVRLALARNLAKVIV